MTAQVLSCRRVAAEWTDDHRALADHLTAMGLPPGMPEWVETTIALLDVDGLPAGVTVILEAGVSNCPL